MTSDIRQVIESARAKRTGTRAIVVPCIKTLVPMPACEIQAFDALLWTTLAAAYPAQLGERPYLINGGCSMTV